MAFDYQALGVAAAGLLTVVGTILTGYQTGKSSRTKDRQAYEAQMEQFRISREAAEELASRTRVEALAADAVLARTRLRETEAEHHDEMRKRYEEIRVLQYDNQRGWDLARFHFGLLTAVMHILSGVFQVLELAAEDEKDRVIAALKNAAARMRDLKIPRTLEEPIPDGKH